MWNRKFLPATLSNLGRKPLRGPSVFDVSVLQYNILGGNHARPAYYPYCNPSDLEWSARKHKITKEITFHDADVLCLEELTEYWTYFRPRLRARDMPYDSAFVQRPSLHANGLAGRRKLDGCGIFWKEHMFNALTVESLNMPDRNDRVALAVLLQHIDTRQLLLVCNTHLYWNAAKEDVQCAELKALDQELTRILCALPDPDIAVVVCGDLNNTPTSAVYKYMTGQLLGSKYCRACTQEAVGGEEIHSPVDDFATLSDGPTVSAAHLAKLPYLQSAYADYQRLPGATVNKSCGIDATFTTVTHKRCCTLDYVFYNPRKMMLTELLEIPREEVLRQRNVSDEDSQSARDIDNKIVAGIPNSVYSSDHLPLIASFVAYPPATGNGGK